jgi:putative membrane protein
VASPFFTTRLRSNTLLEPSAHALGKDVIAQSEQARELPRSSPATASAACVLIGGVIVLTAHELGPTSAHMAAHIGSMNLIAPLTAAFLVRAEFVRPSQPSTVWSAALIQLALIWSCHAPAVQQFLLTSHSVQIASHSILFISALWFWWSLLRLVDWTRWHAIAAVLMTGKFACLLGVLLTFSPRLLHETEGLHETTLSDQQLAGLLMITACPLSYLVAGVVLAAQLIGSPRSAWSASAATTVR